MYFKRAVCLQRYLHAVPLNAFERPLSGIMFDQAGGSNGSGTAIQARASSDSNAPDSGLWANMPAVKLAYVQTDTPPASVNRWSDVCLICESGRSGHRHHV